MHAMKTSLLISSLFLSAVSAFSGIATFYNPGNLAGSCGRTIQNTDFVVALNLAQYTSADCGKQITITSGTKTAIALIEDECPACGTNSLDMTEGLFEFFAPLETGLIQITWDFV